MRLADELSFQKRRTLMFELANVDLERKCNDLQLEKFSLRIAKARTAEACNGIVASICTAKFITACTSIALLLHAGHRFCRGGERI